MVSPLLATLFPKKGINKLSIVISHALHRCVRHGAGERANVLDIRKTRVNNGTVLRVALAPGKQKGALKREFVHGLGCRFRHRMFGLAK